MSKEVTIVDTDKKDHFEIFVGEKSLGVMERSELRQMIQTIDNKIAI